MIRIWEEIRENDPDWRMREFDSMDPEVEERIMRELPSILHS